MGELCKSGDKYASCECPRKHVDCDAFCGAFDAPETIEEYRAALEHWRHHGWLCGCSHGA